MNIDEIKEKVDVKKFFESREKLVTGVVNALKYMILNLIIKGGERLDYKELGELLDVSRVPIREAVQYLEAVGLLEVKNNLGTFVVKLSHKDIEDLWSLRIMLETKSLESGIDRISIEELNKLRQIFRNEIVNKARDPNYRTSDSVNDADDRLHNLIVLSAESDIFSRVYQQIEIYIPMLRHMNRWEYNSSEEHIEIIDAILTKNIGEAKITLENHLRGVLGRLLLDD